MLTDFLKATQKIAIKAGIRILNFLTQMLSSYKAVVLSESIEITDSPAGLGDS